MLKNNLQPANAAGYSHDNARYKGELLTLSGKVVDLYNPKPETLVLSDIANALSITCRFNGQVSKFYSVAQSACLLTAMVPDHLKKIALLYYMPIAYLGEMSESLKVILGKPLFNRNHEFLLVLFSKYDIDSDLSFWKLKELEEYVSFVRSLEHQWLQLGRDIRSSVPIAHLCHAWSSEMALNEFIGLCAQFSIS
jgi:hypothetical protein